MKILLLGEASGLHWTLAEGLRALGHEVCVASDGNGWKNYPRDIDLARPTNSLTDGFRCLFRILRHLHEFRGYDVVQLISPYFLRLRSERTLPVYQYLRRHNGKVFLGAFGTDYYYCKACMESDLYRYSDFKTGDYYRDTPLNRLTLDDWYRGRSARANQQIVDTCDGVIACLWEYYAAYRLYHPDKVTYIPLPIDLRGIQARLRTTPERVNFFIGIQSQRSDVKGTDVMLPVLRQVANDYPDRCRVTEVCDVPFARYRQLLDNADVQLDQLYSYTPSMNSLLAMAKGMVVVGGGEPENYELIGEKQLRPIINVTPDPTDIYRALEDLVLHPQLIPDLSAQSMEYVRRHHDYLRVAAAYAERYTR